MYESSSHTQQQLYLHRVKNVCTPLLNNLCVCHSTNASVCVHSDARALANRTEILHRQRPRSAGRSTLRARADSSSDRRGNLHSISLVRDARRNLRARRRGFRSPKACKPRQRRFRVPLGLRMSGGYRLRKWSGTCPFSLLSSIGISREEQSIYFVLYRVSDIIENEYLSTRTTVIITDL